MSVSGAIGIDLGGSTAVVAVLKKGGVEIITNEASHRETQVVIGFGENERFIGEQGYVQLKSNFKNTIVFPSRFLGVNPNTPFLDEEKKWLYNPLIITEDNKVAFEVTSRGEKRHFLPEQVIAMTLQKLKQFTSREGIVNNDIVISVPSYFTEQERKALLDAAKIAQINVLKLMNESTAVASSYGIFRKSELTSTPRNVCFIDLGHCKASVFVAAFTKEKMSILNQAHERNLGTRDFDWKLLEFYVKMIKEKYGSDVISKDKTRLRLLDAIEKQRKILSANSDAAINVDNVVEDNDLAYTLTRDKFEEIIASVVEKFKQMLMRLKSELNVSLHSIEIVGGGTRIPIIQKAIQETFGLECLRTLNASECIARGCATQAAMLSPLFRVAPYQLEEANYYSIKCSWQFRQDTNMNIESESSADNENQTTVIFPKGCSIPNVKALSFHKDSPIDLTLFYDDPVPQGTQKLLARYVVHTKKAQEPEFGIKIRFLLNKDGIVEFESAQLLEECYEDILNTKADLSGSPNKRKDQNISQEGQVTINGAPEQQEDEIRKKKKTRATNLGADVSSLYSMNATQINKLIDQESQMAYQDRLVHETYEKKNELEGYVYEFRRKIDDKYANYVLPDEKAHILQELDKVESWLYGEGAKASKTAYENKFAEIKKLTGFLEARYIDHETVPEYLSQFSKVIANFESILFGKGTDHNNLSAIERTSVQQAIKTNKSWINEIEQKLKNINKRQNTPVSSQELTNKMQDFMDKFSPFLGKSK